MSALDLFRQGRLEDAINSQADVVKQTPDDNDARFFYFELICFSGELDRANAQLEVLLQFDGELRTGFLLYKHLLESEEERRRVHMGTALPVTPPDSASPLNLRLEALSAFKAKEDGEAVEYISKAMALETQTTGTLNGEAFLNLENSDGLLGPTLEVFAGGRYLWIPYSHIRTLEIAAPASVINTLWIPAKLHDKEDRTASVHLPALYLGTSTNRDEMVRTGQRTEWTDFHATAFLGQGQQMVQTSTPSGETTHIPILSIRNITISPPGFTCD